MAVSIEIKQILESLDLDELEYFNKISTKTDFHIFEQFVKKMVDGEKNYIYKFPNTDPLKLAIEHSFARGKVASYEVFVQLVKNAGQELERRLKSK